MIKTIANALVGSIGFNTLCITMIVYNTYIQNYQEAMVWSFVIIVFIPSMYYREKYNVFNNLKELKNINAKLDIIIQKQND
jgi:hypothetical protein